MAVIVWELFGVWGYLVVLFAALLSVCAMKGIPIGLPLAQWGKDFTYYLTPFLSLVNWDMHYPGSVCRGTDLPSDRLHTYVALQPRREETDWSGCFQMAVQGALWLAKRLSLNLYFSFFNRISQLSYQVATQLSSWGWVDPVPDPILLEEFLGYSRESNPGPLG